MIVTEELVEGMREAGLTVVEMPGWQSRGESGPFSIRGILLHHDASGLHNDDVPNFMSQNGEKGSQLWIKYTGEVYVLAAGLKWHAGSGRGFRNIPEEDGNAYCIGIETDYSGFGPRPEAIDVAIHQLTRVLVDYFGMDPQRDLALHKEYAPDRKIDLANFDADAWREKAGNSVPARSGLPASAAVAGSFLASILHWL
jgi:N-acetyl-anhydromuramyl-L-alanine amidase AmpD